MARRGGRLDRGAARAGSGCEPVGSLRPGARSAVGDGDPRADGERRRLLQGRPRRRCVTRRRSPSSSAARRPDCIPPLLAVDRARGWMLMEDGGHDAPRPDRDRARPASLARRAPALRERPDRPDGRHQTSCSRSACPTSGSRRCRRAVEAVLDEIVGPARRRAAPARGLRCPGCARCATSSPSAGIPETIQHDDFHDAQVFVRDGRYLLLDWGDACVSHPFFTLAVTLDGVIAWGVDDVEGSVADGAVPRRLP